MSAAPSLQVLPRSEPQPDPEPGPLTLDDFGGAPPDLPPPYLQHRPEGLDPICFRRIVRMKHDFPEFNVCAGDSLIIDDDDACTVLAVIRGERGLRRGGR